jgi:hypothetical protein
VLYQSLPGDDPAKSRAYWIEDAKGVHFTGIGPGEMREVPGASGRAAAASGGEVAASSGTAAAAPSDGEAAASSGTAAAAPSGGEAAASSGTAAAAPGGCAVAAFPSDGGSVLLAFTEPAKPVGFHLWLCAYHPGEQAVLDSARVGESGTSDFKLAPVQDGAAWADVPPSSGTASCVKDCGEVLGSKALSIATEGLVEYRSARVLGGSIKTVLEPNQTFAAADMKRFFGSLPAFEKAFQFDPAAGFLTRWYRRAKLADGRECLNLELDRSMPGFSGRDAWTCAR